MDANKIEEVKNILLLPIEGAYRGKRSKDSFQEKTEIEYKNVTKLPTISLNKNGDKIITLKRYYPYYYDDTDMSGIAVKFYELFYSELLNGTSILAEDKLSNSVLSGDTMNSFNTTANKVITKKARQNEKEWPEYLKKYGKQYHCLANFWLLPMQLGRTLQSTSSILGIDINKVTSSADYMTDYLNLLRENFDYLKNIPYFSFFSNFEDFISIHQLPEVRIDSSAAPEMIITQMTLFIEQRADLIANSEKGSSLYQLFLEENLIKEK